MAQAGTEAAAMVPIRESDAQVDLLLRDFKPEQMVKLPEHHPQRFPIPAYDAHNHLGRWHTDGWAIKDVPAFVAMLDEVNVAGVVNLDGAWGDELETNLDRYERAYPGRFASFARLDWSQTTSPGWPERLAASMRDSARRGASGLKLWKDIGLRLKDEKGELFFLDDPRLAPVWAEVADAQIPILVHIADPAAFFRPLDNTNERYEELVRHPDWHFYGPEFPSLQRLLDSLESCVAANPRVNFIGAHVGCYAEDLGWVDRLMTSHPNFHVDISARIAELGRQPRATRKLCLKHPDRVLLGTDIFPPKAGDYRRYLRFLATEDECFPYSDSNPPGVGRWTISAIDLPDEVLAQVIAGNARRIIPAFSRDAR
ncbi:MAG: amidohydrolase family protein [Devosia sp.]